MTNPKARRRDAGLRHSSLLWCLMLGVCARLSAASLEINITPEFKGEPLQPDSLRYETSAKENFSITRVSFLISGLALQRADGSWLELTNEVAWFDMERSRSSHRVAFVPSGEYRTIRFHIGPDARQNHSDPAQYAADHPLNPNLNNLHWDWQGGYIFLAVEGMWKPVAAGILPAVEPGFQPGGTNATSFDDSEKNAAQSGRQDAALYGGQDGHRYDGWSFHFARDTNRTAITLAALLNLTNDTRLELAFDLATLLNAPRPISFGKDGSSTHSRAGDPIAAALAANLPGSFQVSRVSSLSSEEIAGRTLKPLYLPEKFTPYPFQMSGTFPIPDLPRDNPLITERVALGEKLFHDPRLSKDNTISCASCHDEKHAFTDPRRYSIGVRGQVGTRNAMPLFNLAWRNSFFWDGRAPSLRAQALMPIQDHTEMDEALTNVVAKLSKLSAVSHQLSATNTSLAPNSQLLTSNSYPSLFTAAFGSPAITPEKIGLAIESFLLTITSYDSKFDRAIRGEAALNEQEQRGLQLFMTEYDPRREQFGADCFHCHGGPLFQSQTFANNGLDSEFTDPGRAKVTGKDSDKGKFATPSLRNIALTAPYMHDGRFKTLEEVVEHYSTGMKRSATLDPNLAKHPDGGIRLSEEDRKALVAFLMALTDEKYPK